MERSFWDFTPGEQSVVRESFEFDEETTPPPVVCDAKTQPEEFQRLIDEKQSLLNQPFDWAIRYTDYTARQGLSELEKAVIDRKVVMDQCRYCKAEVGDGNRFLMNDSSGRPEFVICSACRESVEGAYRAGKE